MGLRNYVARSCDEIRQDLHDIRAGGRLLARTLVLPALIGSCTLTVVVVVSGPSRTPPQANPAPVPVPSTIIVTMTPTAPPASAPTPTVTVTAPPSPVTEESKTSARPEVEKVSAGEQRPLSDVQGSAYVRQCGADGGGAVPGQKCTVEVQNLDNMPRTFKVTMKCEAGGPTYSSRDCGTYTATTARILPGAFAEAEFTFKNNVVNGYMARWESAATATS
ncbi:hypothetical protein ACFQ7O_18630 [Streptomyces sp. NPDC056485]|uniref:hypothetical protein n=1 Tax=Streptomyces sp. NPDC056485 TaxID=3345834 RepID=UPI0036AB1DAA